MAFDPITGEPVEEQPTQEAGAFDPMTGEPIVKQEVPEQNILGFDPMTGEPIGKQEIPEQNAPGFDPITGEPIGKQEVPEQNTPGFDPITGEPISQPAASTAQEATGFDPMTGEPISKQEIPEQNAIGFDPMTGKPLGEPAANVSQEATGFDPMTGEPISKQEIPEQNAPCFDPMTGAPIGQPAASVTQEAAGFDPMTGKLLGQSAASVTQEVPGFDPMTGEPIGKQEIPEQNAPCFDPMTGKPLGEPAASVTQEAIGFDPMTGKPLGEPAASVTQEAPGFDPMTGKPLGEPAAGTTQEAAGFDPMTGKPLGQSTTSQTQERGAQQKPAGFDPMTGKPLKDKKSKLPIIIGGIAAAVAVVVLVFAAISSGLFLGKAGKITMAVANTFKDRPHFVKDFSTLSILAGDKYTIAVAVNGEDIKVKGELRVSSKEKQVWAQIDSNSYSKIELLAGVDSSAARVSVPAVSKNVFTYNYKAKNNGYLMDELSDDEIDEMNAIFQYLAEGNKSADKVKIEILKVFTNEIKYIKFTNAEKENYTINDEKVACKGYKGTITSSNLIHIVDEIEKIIHNNYDALFGIDTFDLEDFEDSLEDIKDDLEYFEDIEVTFYIYKNKLAAIKLEELEYYDDMELCFEGGDYRMQNIAFESDDYKLQLVGKDTGTKETFTLRERYGRNSWNELGKLEYNYDSGKFDFQLDDVGIEGKLTKSNSGLTVKINRFSQSYYSLKTDIDISIARGAKMEKYSGKEFDVGNADEDDLMDIVDDMYDTLYDSGLYYLLSNYGIGYYNFYY